MSSLIEQAALRLEQLRRAGAVVPDGSGAAAPWQAGAGPAVTAPAPAPAAPVTHSKQVELDLDALAQHGIVTPHGARSQLGDQFRVIKRPLIENAAAVRGASSSHANLVMITSAVAGEGKTFTSVNLAMSIAAELDHTVMLIDADVARPSLMRTLGLPPGPGLLDVLEASVDMSSVLLRTNIEKLTILPSGTPHPRATELLASDAMRQLIDEIATRYADRIVIFDSPPLLLTTESRVLASHMGQIVVVVQAERTLQADVQHALATIESCPVRFVVLNQLRTTSGGYGYGYGYGRGYGYGYEHGKPAT